MQTQFKRGDLVQVRDMHGRDMMHQGIYIAYDPTHSKPHLVRRPNRKYGLDRYNHCEIISEHNA